jgi:outer membrane protein OmpA-like peptidoglycan-associated protein
MSNFRFEMTELRKSGGLVEMDFKITNLAPEDRQLKACPDMMYLYDDLGNFYHPAQVCISQSCRDGIGKKVGVKTEFYCSYGVRAEAMMPSGIPLNGKVVIKDVNNRATKFVRANWILQSEQALELQYGDIIFPDGVDDDNPNRQIAGKQTYTLLDAKRKGREVHVRLSAFNRATQPHPLTITGVTAYDDQGSVLGAKSIRFGKGGTPVIADRYRGWQHSLPGTESVPLTLIVEEVPTAATQLLRLDVDFGDYTLHWSDVPIAGGGGSRAKADATASGGPSPAGNDYMEYENFKREAKEIERVVDKHVILDHIYFDSGSDNLLSTSFAQLDDLAATLNQYPDLRIEISGHTDNVGAKTSNMLLSQKRADAVKYYLIAHNVPPARMESVGFGDTRPISGNTTDEGKQDNRRVEIRVVR